VARGRQIAELEVREQVMAEHKVSVETAGGSKYRVTVEEGDTKTVHEVVASPELVERYGRGATAEDLLKASFEFLLRRESKESILRRFELSEVERYFPDYPQKIRTLL
jgi:hypothetical protein